MEQRPFGKTNMLTSVLGFGGSEIGYRGTSRPDVERLLGRALDAGLNVIDTAECYKTSEERIGETISHRRNEYYLFTKCGHASGLNFPDWSPKLLGANIERSLKRLRTDYVDLVLLHSCSLETLRQGEVIEVLQKAKQAGKTRYIGYSGDHEAAVHAVELGVFDALETSVNIADQEAIERTVPRALAHGMGVIAKRPIANTAWIDPEKPLDNYSKPYWERLKDLRYDFLQQGAAEAVEVALRFTLSVPGVHTAVVGTQNPERYEQNARMVAKGILSSIEYEAIREKWAYVAKADWIGQI